MFPCEFSPPPLPLSSKALTMRLVVPVVILCALARVSASSPDPACTALSQAYDHLWAKDYDKAIASFEKAVEAAPTRPSICKELCLYAAQSR